MSNSANICEEILDSDVVVGHEFARVAQVLTWSKTISDNGDSRILCDWKLCSCVLAVDVLEY